MAWQTPKLDYAVGYIPTPADLNRIEGNTKYLREETATFNGLKTFTANMQVNAEIKSTVGGESLTFGEGFKIEATRATYNYLNAVNVGGKWVINTNGITGITDPAAIFDATDVTINRHINPTTTPTESTTATLSTNGATAIIPRGLFDIVPIVNGSTSSTIYLEKYENGGWTLIKSVVTPSVDFVLPLISSTGSASGAGALRIRMTTGAVATASARLVKY